MPEKCKEFIKEFSNLIPFVSLVNILRAYEYYEIGNLPEATRMLEAYKQD